MNSVYAIEMNDFEIAKEIFNFKSLLSMEKQIRVEKFVRDIDKCQCILGELLLRYSLWNFYDYKCKNIELLYNEFGKPRLHYTDDRNIHFNISHSANWIVCGIFNRPVGIDIEYIDNNSNIYGIVQRFFTNSENHYIQMQIPNRQVESFFKLWTLKESYVKCVGKGLSIPLNLFSININRDKILLYTNNQIDYSYSFMSKKMSDDLYLGVCVNNCEQYVGNVNIINISIQQILDWGKNQAIHLS